MIKKILLGILGLVAVAAVGLFLLGSNIDSIVKAAVEKYGTEATKAKTTLASVYLSARNGEGKLEGFTLGNPDGFATDSAIKIGKISVKIDPKTLMGTGAIVIDDITIDAPQVTYEVSAKGESNLQTIQNNATAYAGALTGGKKQDGAAQKDAKPEESRKILIKKLTIKNGEVTLNHELLKGDNLIAAKLPVIQMTNIGGDKGGTTPVAVARAILEKLTAAAISVGQNNLVKKLREQGLNSLKGAAEESEVGKAVTKALDGIFSK